MPDRTWKLGNGRTLPLDRPRVLAILNVTPDSFSDAGALPTPESCVARAREAIAHGADMLDIGGESTRPGAGRVPPPEQIARTVPPIEAIRAAGIDAPISIDTTRSDVARAALDAGADAINDVSGATEDHAMLALASERACGLVLMHRLRPPDADSYSDRYTTDAPEYPGGVVDAVRRTLRVMAQRALDAGCAPGTIVLDPGLGFGKTVEQNLELIRSPRAFEALGFPTLSAASRKSFVGTVSGVERPSRRVSGSVAISVAHCLAGVRLFRVHDVAEHAQALRMARELGF